MPVPRSLLMSAHALALPGVATLERNEATDSLKSVTEVDSVIAWSHALALRGAVLARAGFPLSCGFYSLVRHGAARCATRRPRAI
jgi:hypothetical protein